MLIHSHAFLKWIKFITLNISTQEVDGKMLKGMYECFNADPEMLSSKEKEYINSTLRNKLIKSYSVLIHSHAFLKWIKFITLNITLVNDSSFVNYPVIVHLGYQVIEGYEVHRELGYVNKVRLVVSNIFDYGDGLRYYGQAVNVISYLDLFTHVMKFLLLNL